MISPNPTIDNFNNYKRHYYIVKATKVSGPVQYSAYFTAKKVAAIRAYYIVIATNKAFPLVVPPSVFFYNTPIIDICVDLIASTAAKTVIDTNRTYLLDNNRRIVSI